MHIDIITNNPFRILGVFSNASARDIAANIHRISAYQRVNRDVSFSPDLAGMLGKCNRTTNSVAQAQTEINLPQDKIKYALFWFVKSDVADEIAINHLAVGNVDKAKEIFRKGRNFSSKINLGVLSFIQSDYVTCVKQIESVIEDDLDRDNFVKSVCGVTYSVDRTTLNSIFIEEMWQLVSPEQLLEIYSSITGLSSETKSYVRKKVVDGYIDKIESELSTAQNVNSKDSHASYDAGVRLMNNTKTVLSKLKSVLGSNDMQFTRISDKLANQILQCGINYFNNTPESKSTSISKAYTLQNYAGQIAVGQMAKDRCKKNLAILDSLKEEAKIESDLNYIANQLKSSLLTSINDAIYMVQRCKPHLLSIRNVLGSDNETYLSISDMVASRAVAVSIDKVNADQQRLSNAHAAYSYTIVSTLGTTKSDIEASISLFNNVQQMDLSPKMRQHVNSNKKTLLSLKGSIESLSSLASPRSSSSGYSGYSGSYSSSSSEGSGCMVIILALIILGCLGGLLI